MLVRVGVRVDAGEVPDWNTCSEKAGHMEAGGEGPGGGGKGDDGEGVGLDDGDDGVVGSVDFRVDETL
jgi:hypothetical protein